MPRLLSAACCLLGMILPLACTGQNAPSTDPAAATGETKASSKTTYSACHVDGPYIAMTFDDGPHATNTPRLLDMLKQRGIKATFFMVGQCAAEYPAIVKRIAAEGHEVANHSWSHPQLTKLTDEGVKEQLKKTHDAIVAGCGVAPKVMRPPYGAFSERQRRWAAGEFGYKTILWDVDPLDWKVRNSAHVESEILKHTVNGSIILSHDIHKSTVDAMPDTLDKLTAKGFKFVTVSQLIAMDRPVAAKPKATPSVTKKSDGATIATSVEPSAQASGPAPKAATPAPAPAAAGPQ
jgi:peptidoglycan/xylan/chitin deacetylase (PgdA/CDA1 family)